MISKKKKFSKRIIISVLILNVLYVIGAFIVFWHTGAEPATLTAAWFGFTTAEIWSLASIKKKKVDKENEQQ